MSPMLAGSVIVSDGDIHVWSGNLDENSQKTAEQLPTVNRWGANSNEYTYIIASITTDNISKLWSWCRHQRMFVRSCVYLTY